MEFHIVVDKIFIRNLSEVIKLLSSQIYITFAFKKLYTTNPTSQEQRRVGKVQNVERL